MPHNTARKKNLLKKHNLSGVNKPKRTPKHPTKSHIVLAQEGHQLKLIRFGQQGAKTAGKKQDAKSKAKRKSFASICNSHYFLIFFIFPFLVLANLCVLVSLISVP